MTGAFNHRIVVLLVLLVAVSGAIVGGLWMVITDDRPDDLTVEWRSETSTSYQGNHHMIGIATGDGAPIIGVPLNDLDDAETCGIVALDSNGTIRWRETFDPAHCTPHAVGDIAVGDLSRDGREEFFAGTEERLVLGYDARSGDESFRHDLESIGFTPPLLVDLTGDGRPELAIADLEGTLHVLRADGSNEWTTELDGHVLLEPIETMATDDGSSELAVTTTNGTVVVFDGDGSVIHRIDLERNANSWSAVETNRGAGLVIATRTDELLLIDATSGEQRWAVPIESRKVTVGTDGTAVYTASIDGVVRSIDVGTGSVRWEKPVTSGDIRSMHAPVFGDVSGDGANELVVAASDGTIGVFDPETGATLARHRIDGALYTPPALADVTGDGTDDMLVLTGDGHVVALSYEVD